MNRNEIRLNYNKMLSQARRLEELANEINCMTDGDLEQMMCTLSDAWKGEDGKDFRNKGNQLIRLTRVHGKSLQKTADVLRRNAENTYRAELRMIELAEKRGWLS